jgi:hypothetical protein
MGVTEPATLRADCGEAKQSAALLGRLATSFGSVARHNPARRGPLAARWQAFRNILSGEGSCWGPPVGVIMCRVGTARRRAMLGMTVILPVLLGGCDVFRRCPAPFCPDDPLNREYTSVRRLSLTRGPDWAEKNEGSEGKGWVRRTFNGENYLSSPLQQIATHPQSGRSTRLP